MLVLLVFTIDVDWIAVAPNGFRKFFVLVVCVVLPMGVGREACSFVSWGC